jgi:transposase InsO family protein
MLTTLLLADAVSKGGPGSGPRPGNGPTKKETDSALRSLYNRDDPVRYNPPKEAGAASKLAEDHSKDARVVAAGAEAARNDTHLNDQASKAAGVAQYAHQRAATAQSKAGNSEKAAYHSDQAKQFRSMYSRYGRRAGY